MFCYNYYSSSINSNGNTSNYNNDHQHQNTIIHVNRAKKPLIQANTADQQILIHTNVNIGNVQCLTVNMIHISKRNSLRLYIYLKNRRNLKFLIHFEYFLNEQNFVSIFIRTCSCLSLRTVIYNTF